MYYSISNAPLIKIFGPLLFKVIPSTKYSVADYEKNHFQKSCLTMEVVEKRRNAVKNNRDLAISFLTKDS